ncbi:antirestriction protein ArdC [Sphingobium boeckii]|uniref:Antirestriction protein ArdC n=1 Tax=Sphingobium boeckii TaxID=1082345 RepID=A0A7W9AIL3_9SPHN|nr:antirestriction protein ArdC [Sphingobium boeckii]
MIMPNRRAADGRKTNLNQRPRGIIRVPALCPLCRYRHKTHATGHRSRLDRDQTAAFGTKDYAREELIAEMGSAFLCAALGIVPTVRHADYIGAWLEVLRDDNRAIFRAASAATKAADWLLARHQATAADAVSLELAA